MPMNTTENQVNKAGLPPGSAVYVGSKPFGNTTVNHLCYNKTDIESFEGFDLARFNNAGLCNHLLLISGLHNASLIEEICRHFEINQLIIEDILNTHHIPKIEDYGSYAFITLKDLEMEQGHQKITVNQYSFILMPHLVICFSESSNSIFDPVLMRLHQNSSRVRAKNSDYLLFEMLDVIIDRYIVLCENLNAFTNKLEEGVYRNPAKDFLRKVLYNKKNLTGTYQSLAPLYEQISKLKKTENELVSKTAFKYVEDLSDHLKYSLQTIESLRELNISIRDSYTNELNLKMNKVMQVLTLVATIFIPLSFFAGIYGMNFENMPELHTRYGYFVFLGVIISIGVGLVIFFKKKKWF